MPEDSAILSKLRRCPYCNKDKPSESFARTSSYCEPCRKQYRRDNIERTRAYTAANRDRIRDASFRKIYGITLEHYNHLLSKQNGRCALCRTDVPGGRGHFHVDHNHETGKVRGLLCHNCNIGLGNFRDNPELLRRAARYISRGR